MYQMKKMISLLLALVMILSMGPVPVRAAEADCHSENYHAVQERINEILTTYLGTTQMSEDEINSAVADMDPDTVFFAVCDVEDLEYSDEIAALSEEELLTLLDSNVSFSDFATTVIEKFMSENQGTVLKTVNTLDGQISLADTAGTISVSGTTVTATITGSTLSKKTNTITITNATENTATLKFDYSASNYNSLTIDSGSVGSSGNYSKLLTAGATVTVAFQSKSGLGDKKGTLTLSNFSLTVAKDSSNVTFNFDSALGSVTAGGAAVASGDVKEVSLADGIALVATANGSTFLGWVDADGEILSTAASYTLKPASDTTVTAAFAKDGGTPWFAVGAASKKSQSSGLLGLGKLYYYQVGTSYLFDDLNAAATFAESSTSKTIVLMNNGTLPAGDYTIPSGVTLLIPFDSANTMYTTEAQGKEDVTSGDYEKPKEYRVLTMADGANLTINGAMSLSAKHYYAKGSKKHGGSPTGPCSFVKMEGSSNITVNNGGVLYAYGFIYGSGSVTANSGATVYEMFQIADFRGGSQSTDMDNGVFPLSQYYIQNIEVPLTLYSGATEYAYTTVYMQNSDFGSAVAFIAKSNAMFNLTSGYVKKQYDGATDRMSVEIHGNLNLSAINLSVGTSSINSKDYDLPINGNMTVAVKSGEVSINQDLAFLPGSRLILDQGATCTLGTGINIYVYDADEWGGYCSPSNLNFVPVAYARSRTYTRTAADLVDAVVQIDGTANLSNGYAYTTAGGASIISTGSGKVITTAGSQTATHQIVQGEPSKYMEIPLNPVKLKNADESFTATGGEDPEILGNNLPTYIYKDGKWSLDTGGCEGGCIPGSEPTCVDPQVCTVCRKVLQKAKGHTEVIDAAVAPTCTETGLTEGKHCSVCDAVLVAQTKAAALGHKYTVTDSQEATCTEDGYKTYTCENDSTHTYTETLTHQGHTEEEIPAVAATCEETGLTAGKKCSVCGEVLVAQTEVAALGHKYTVTDSQEATCTEDGKIVYTCSCGDSYTEEIAATGHTLTQVEAKAPTCTETGYEAYEYCSACNYTTYKEVAAAGHSYSEEVTTAPTCTEKGVKTFTCACGDSYTEEIAATGHNYVDGVCSACDAEDPEYTENVKLFDITKNNMIMGQNLSLLFAFEKVNIDPAQMDNYVAEVSIAYKDSRGIVESEVASADWTTVKISGVEYWCVTVSNLAAKEMDDDVTVTIYLNGTAVSNPKTMSLRQYGEERLAASTDIKFKTVVVDMLNYGAEAQLYFKYNTANLANRNLTDEQRVLATQNITLDKTREIISDPNNYFIASNVQFKSDIVMLFAVAENSGAVSGKITFVNHKNENVKVVVAEYSSVTVNGKPARMFEFTGMVVADIDQVITVEFFDANGKVLLSLTDSLDAYLGRVKTTSSMYELANAFGKFSTSAYAYLHRNDK